MQIVNLFPTHIFVKECDFDLERLLDKAYKHKSNVKSLNKSGVNSYQGHEFRDNDLENEITDSLPQLETRKLKDIKVSTMWLNINGAESYNQPHTHDPFGNIALSGVFYIKTPENSGNIRFFDPRGIITDAIDMKYYNASTSWFEITPYENLLIIFPSWLYHSVGVNQSIQDRISISFNIKIDFDVCQAQ